MDGIHVCRYTIHIMQCIHISATVTTQSWLLCHNVDPSSGIPLSTYQMCRYSYPRSIAISNLSNLIGTSKISCPLLSNLCGWYLRIVLHTEIVTFSDMRNSVDRCEYKLAIFMTLCWLYGDGDPRCGIPPPLPPLPSLSVLLCLSAATRRMIGGQ